MTLNSWCLNFLQQFVCIIVFIMVFGLGMVYSGSSDETIPLWDYRMFDHQCANVINIGDTKMSNVLLSMICS